MLYVTPSSPLSYLALGLCFVLVCSFELANGFHDSANAVATVIYTKSLRPRTAVVWSGIMNFVGVVVGGIAVAYALVELLPPDVLSPPDGSPAVPMLLSLFATALAWKMVTWWFGIPNSSSHCLIGALIGIVVGDALLTSRDVGRAIDWGPMWSVLLALALSPLLGLVGAGLLYLLIRHFIHDRHLFEPPKDCQPPTTWVRGLLILTCTSVSFSHGTNDGQKSIGLIMLTMVGNTDLTPAQGASAEVVGAGLIEPFGPNGGLRMIVETPRCSGVKFRYEPKLRLFAVGKALPLGLTYPFDWGFIPGTKGEDGDPLDALAIHDAATYPGILLQCRVLGAIELSQEAEAGREANPRFILMPLCHEPLVELANGADLPARLKKEIKRFFLNTAFFTHKDPKIEGWKDPQAAEKEIRRHVLL